MLSEKLRKKLAELAQHGIHRKRKIIDEKVINFSSNDYLSLMSAPEIKQFYQIGFQRYPSGSTGSMLVSGYHPIHRSLEKAFASALGVDDAVLFSSGYAANLSVAGILGHFGINALIDKSVHASVYDGLKLSGVNFSRYLHNDISDMGLKLKAKSERDIVVITESLFSMSGQLAPLNEIALLTKSHQHDLLVDEAHAFGILGQQGLGAVCLHGLTQHEVPLRIIPLGKAYGAQGAIVAGDGVWIEALLQFARSQIYSTAISPAFTYGLLEAFEFVRQADSRRAKLKELVNYFCQAIAQSPLKWRDSITPIQQLQLGCPHRAMDYSNKLLEKSILCFPMRQPTVTKLETGLRIVLNYCHSTREIDYLFNCLHNIETTSYN